MAASPHPFDPLRPAEVELAAQILRESLPETRIRFKVIEVQEPRKQDVIPYIEAERLGNSLPEKPARLVYSMFHRLDTGALMKALINVDRRKLLSVKELPADIEVSSNTASYRTST